MSAAARTRTPAASDGALRPHTLDEGAVRQQRAAIKRDIEREHRRKARAKLVELGEQLRVARLARKNAAASVAMRCRTDRLALREQAQMERAIVMKRLHDAIHAEREAARQTCTLRKEEAKRTTSDAIARARVELEAERKYQDDLRRIEQGNRERRSRTHRASAKERRSESDDEVRTNIAPELHALFEKVKRGITGSARESRTEQFLKYAEEHPNEVLAAIEDKSDAMIRELERKQREVQRHVRRKRYTAAELADVPF